MSVDWNLIGISMVCGLPFLIALLCSNAATHRRLVFAVLAISVFAWIVPGTLWLYPAPLNDFGSTVAEWIQFVRPISWIAVGVLAFAVDRMRQIQHGWLHKVGVIVLLVPPCTTLLNYFAPIPWFN